MRIELAVLLSPSRSNTLDSDPSRWHPSWSKGPRRFSTVFMRALGCRSHCFPRTGAIGNTFGRQRYQYDQRRRRERG
jgi:hypothetical protein